MLYYKIGVINYIIYRLQFVMVLQSIRILSEAVLSTTPKTHVKSVKEIGVLNHVKTK